MTGSSPRRFTGSRARLLALALALPPLAGGSAACDHGGGDRAGGSGAGSASEALDGDATAYAPGRPAGDAAAERSASMVADFPAPAPVPPAYQDVGDTAVSRMRIRSGRAQVEVDSIESAAASLQAVAEDLGGHTTSINIRRGDRAVPSARLELRVPADRFDALVAALEEVGEVEELSVESQEVTEQYRDLTARLANLRRLEERLVDLLARRTGDLEDVLAVERELARVRQESDQVEGRLRYLRDRVALSTLTVLLAEPPSLLDGRPGDNPILEAFRGAWQNFLAFVVLLIEALGVLVPLAILLLIGWAVFRWWTRRRWKGRAATREE